MAKTITLTLTEDELKTIGEAIANRVAHLWQAERTEYVQSQLEKLEVVGSMVDDKLCALEAL